MVALLLQLLDPAQRQALEARIGMDLTEWYRNNENEAIRQSFQRGEAKGEARGKTEGKAEAVLNVLAARGLRPTPRQEERIRGCQNTAQLDRWLLLALSATSVAEVLEDPT